MDCRRRPALSALSVAIFRAIARFANETHSQQPQQHHNSPHRYDSTGPRLAFVILTALRARPCFFFLLPFLLLLPAVFLSTAANAQQQGSTCSDLNRTIFPWYLGRADNHVYICDGSAFQTLLTATESPMQIGLGTTSPGAGLDVQFPETTVSGVAIGTRYQQTLTAAANGDNLTAVTISPTFVNGSYTGVKNNGLIVASGNVGIGTTAPAAVLDAWAGGASQMQVTSSKVAFNTIGDLGGQLNVSTTGTTRWAFTSTGSLRYFANSPTTTIPLYIAGASGQTADLQEWQNSIATPLAGITASGGAYFTGNVGIGSTAPVSSLDLSQKTDAVALPAGTVGQRPGSPVNGMLRYDSSGTPALEAYVNGAWESLITATGGTSALTLGASASATNPQRSGDATTGLFSAASGTVSIASAGTDVMDVAPTGPNILGTITSGSYSVGYRINGNNAVWQDATNFNLAVGATAFPTTISQSGGGNNGKYNVAVGYQALNADTTGSFNTAVGYSLLVNTTGYGNTATGYEALDANTAGYQNTAVGVYALRANITGYNNVALGDQVLYTNTTGAANTAIGTQALYANTTGQYNTAVGLSALGSNTIGVNNTALGYQAGYDVTTGGHNVIIGDYSTTGVGITTGSNNILIGQNLQELTQTSSNQLDIGNLIFATGLGSGTTMSTGNVGIGTASPSEKLSVASNGASMAPIGLHDTQASGDVYFIDNGYPAVGVFGIRDSNLGQTVLALKGGSVGIGTNAPPAKLSLQGDDEVLRITSALGGNRYYSIGRNSSSGRLYLNAAESGYGGYEFAVYPNGGSANTTAFIVSSSGKAGVGSSVNPSGNFEISNPAAASTDTRYLYLNRSAGNYGYSFDIDDQSSGKMFLQTVVNGSVINLMTFAGASGGSSNPIGIGTTSPANALDVNGSLAIGSYAGTATGASNELIVSGSVGIGSTAPVASLDLSQKTDAVALPAGTTGQRPGSPANGMLRYNSTVPQVEAYYGGAWNALGGGGGGGGGAISAPVTVPIRVITAAGAVTVSATTDYYICVNKTSGAATTVNLPASPATGLMYIIKDCKGDAATNNITVTPASGTIDGASAFVMSTNYQALGVTYNGTQWNTQ
jgi:hypothetical protein